jgi:hypothetical protein
MATVLIDADDLFLLRVAASVWLRENRDDPNHDAVEAALIATNVVRVAEEGKQ